MAHRTWKHAHSTSEGYVELLNPHHHSTSHHSPFPLPTFPPLEILYWWAPSHPASQPGISLAGFHWELSLHNQTWNTCTFLPGTTFSVVPENREDLGVFIMWVTSGEGWRGQPQITLNTVKRSCLQCLESGLAVKHSNQAEYTMWTEMLNWLWVLPP